MIFESLKSSADNGELMLIDDGMCHFHLRRDGQLTIREIISTRPGAGGRMLRRLEHTPGAQSLFAKCPIDLPANDWYARRGFIRERTEVTRSGRRLVCWRKPLARQWQPNAGRVEVIFCANGGARWAEIAIDSGMAYGAQLPGSVRYRPYMADQDWKSPERHAYMVALAEHQPWLATVIDYERPDQLSEVISWCAEAALHVEMLIVIPKWRGAISTIPHSIAGKPIRLGYSVPTRYGGTNLHVTEFTGWPHGVHLLGGSPERQMQLYGLMDVRSADTNYHQKMAQEFGTFWTPKSHRHYKSPHYPRLDEIGSSRGRDGIYEAFRRSCHNIMATWRELTTLPVARPDARQIAMKF